MDGDVSSAALILIVGFGIYSCRRFAPSAGIVRDVARSCSSI